jgi:hypothetical protein
MNDFTQYPEALELKQLGFDEPCIAYFARDTRGLCWHSNSVVPYNHNDIDKYCDLSAPTYSQAFRWFRHEYALESYIRANLCVDVPKTYQFNIDDNIDDVWYDTYEEAELACLKKLIEIVKGGNK